MKKDDKKEIKYMNVLWTKLCTKNLKRSVRLMA